MRDYKKYRKIYEDNYGPIPDGYHIHHIDGNRNNNDPSNLKAVTPLEHLAIHERQGDRRAANLLRMNYYGYSSEYPCYSRELGSTEAVRLWRISNQKFIRIPEYLDYTEVEVYYLDEIFSENGILSLGSRP